MPAQPSVWTVTAASDTQELVSPPDFFTANSEKILAAIGPVGGDVPVASTSVLGTVRVGNGLSIDGQGILSITTALADTLTQRIQDKLGSFALQAGSG